MVSMMRETNVFLANLIFSVMFLGNVNLESNISPKCLCFNIIKKYMWLITYIIYL